MKSTLYTQIFSQRQSSFVVTRVTLFLITSTLLTLPKIWIYLLSFHRSHSIHSPHYSSIFYESLPQYTTIEYHSTTNTSIVNTCIIEELIEFLHSTLLQTMELLWLSFTTHLLLSPYTLTTQAPPSTLIISCNPNTLYLVLLYFMGNR